ncbi:hypothetical protein V6N13_125847 [Hibiscus sabdariffa]
MWNFACNAIGSIGFKSSKETSQACSECSDDEVCSNGSRDEGLDCPICWESFNIVENVPYVLWCGHTLCQNCVMGLQPALLKFHTQQIMIPVFISCPWCHLLSLRLAYKGNLKFPRKNFFILWMIESLNGDRYGIARRNLSGENQLVGSPRCNLMLGHQANHGVVRRGSYVNRSEQIRECCYPITLFAGDGCFCHPGFLGSMRYMVPSEHIYWCNLASSFFGRSLHCFYLKFSSSIAVSDLKTYQKLVLAIVVMPLMMSLKWHLPVVQA